MENLEYTNGKVMGYEVVVTTAMDTAGVLVVDFNTLFDIVATVQVRTASGVCVALADAVITYPATGQVSIADGGATFSVTDTNIVTIIAFRKRS